VEGTRQRQQALATAGASNRCIACRQHDELRVQPHVFEHFPRLQKPIVLRTVRHRWNGEYERRIQGKALIHNAMERSRGSSFTRMQMTATMWTTTISSASGSGRLLLALISA
jgi:hypothetical protein